MVANGMVWTGPALLFTLTLSGAPGHAQPSSGLYGASSLELSAQATREAQRPRPRITVRPLRRTGPLYRECVAVYQEKWRPYWGGYVVYPGMRCWWARE
jgi:hypothetical protein